MKGKPKKSSREKDLTSRYLSGNFDEDRVDSSERFKARNKTLQRDKTARTAAARAEEESGADIDTLPVGEVVQVHSLFCDVRHEGKTYLCVIRRTLTKISDTYLVVGDLVRFRDGTKRDDAGNPTGDPNAPPEGVVEQILPRRTVLTRADSFKGNTQHPIVANAGQMLIVASLRQPRIKWGLIDRMIVAARSGGLRPVVCLNKMDLVEPEPGGDEPAAKSMAKDVARADEALAHYAATLGVRSLRTSVSLGVGLDELRDVLRDEATVLAGHSGVGKSSLIRAIQPHLDIRIGAISGYTDKGRHTTTSARRYPLDFGGAVIDTPGVKLFGLWGVTRDNLSDYFPDVGDGTAPDWRRESFDRIAESLAGA